MEKSGYFVVHILAVEQMETLLYMGANSRSPMLDKLDKCTTLHQDGCDIPLVSGSDGCLLCRATRNRQQEQQSDPVMGECLSAWSDTLVFDGRHWLFEGARSAYIVHNVGGGQFCARVRGTKLAHGPGQD